MESLLCGTNTLCCTGGYRKQTPMEHWNTTQTNADINLGSQTCLPLVASGTLATAVVEANYIDLFYFLIVQSNILNA